MREIKGDFVTEFNRIDAKYEAIVCTINNVVKNNGELVMGAGIAKVFAEIYPHLPKLWGERVKRQGSQLLVDEAMDYGYNVTYLIGLPTKLHWKDPSPRDLILQSIRQLVEFVDVMDLKKVLMTRPGCGNGGWDWNELNKSIGFDAWLDDRFFVINKD